MISTDLSWNDGQTDKSSYGDTRSHLIQISINFIDSGILYFESLMFDEGNRNSFESVIVSGDS